MCIRDSTLILEAPSHAGSATRKVVTSPGVCHPDVIERSIAIVFREPPGYQSVSQLRWRRQACGNRGTQVIFSDCLGLTEEVRMTAPNAAKVEELRKGFKGKVITQGDNEYEESRKIWNGMVAVSYTHLRAHETP